MWAALVFDARWWLWVCGCAVLELTPKSTRTLLDTNTRCLPRFSLDRNHFDDSPGDAGVLQLKFKARTDLRLRSIFVVADDDDAIITFNYLKHRRHLAQLLGERGTQNLSASFAYPGVQQLVTLCPKCLDS